MMSHHVTRIVVLSVVVAVVLTTYQVSSPPVCDAQGPGCTRNGLKHAIADISVPDAGICSGLSCGIDKATDNMEVAEPYLNPCSTYLPRERWASNVLWIYSPNGDGGFDGVAEIGWRKICTINGASKRFFFAVSRQGVVNNDDYLDASLVPQTGATYEFTMESMGNGRWIGKITGPGLGTGIEVSKTLNGFVSGSNIQTGGENMYDVPDMGVVGHKDVRFRLTNGSTFTMINQPFSIAEVSGRYSIVAAQNYFQTRSNIHTGPTPTPVVNTDACAPGWN